mgnify:CR=1 FL=1
MAPDPFHVHFEKRRVGKNALPALRVGIDFNRACLYPFV